MGFGRGVLDYLDIQTRLCLDIGEHRRRRWWLQQKTCRLQEVCDEQPPAQHQLRGRGVWQQQRRGGARGEEEERSRGSHFEICKKER